MPAMTNRRRALAVSTAAVAATAGLLVASTGASALAFSPTALTAPAKKAPAKAAVPIENNMYMPATLTVKPLPADRRLSATGRSAGR